MSLRWPYTRVVLSSPVRWIAGPVIGPDLQGQLSVHVYRVSDRSISSGPVIGLFLQGQLSVYFFRASYRSNLVSLDIGRFTSIMIKIHTNLCKEKATVMNFTILLAFVIIWLNKVNLRFDMRGKTKHAIYFTMHLGKVEDSMLRKKTLLSLKKKKLTLVQEKISLIYYQLTLNQEVRLMWWLIVIQYFLCMWE